MVFITLFYFCVNKKSENLIYEILGFDMERMRRFELPSLAWKAKVLALVRHPRKWWGEGLTTLLTGGSTTPPDAFCTVSYSALEVPIKIVPREPLSLSAGTTPGTCFPHKSP